VTGYLRPAGIVPAGICETINGAMIMAKKIETGRYAVTCRCCKEHWTATIDPKTGQGLFVELAAAHHCEKFDAARERIGNYQLGTVYLTVEAITHDPAGTQHKCGARCRSAKGGACECSCKGLNHGIAYAK
jgi:hypothetical protein